MPPIRRYIVEETRELEIDAENPTDAVAKAQPYFENSETGAHVDIQITRIDATRKF